MIRPKLRRVPNTEVAVLKLDGRTIEAEVPKTDPMPIHAMLIIVLARLLSRNDKDLESVITREATAFGDEIESMIGANGN